MYGLLILLDLLTLLVTPAAFTHCKSSIAITHFSNKLPPFQGKKILSPLPLISPSPFPLIHKLLLIMTVTLHVDLFGMFYHVLEVLICF